MNDINEDGEIRWGAVEAIGKLGNENYLPYLLPFLNDSADMNVKFFQAIIEAIGKLGNEKHVPLLLPFFHDTSANAEIRCNALKAIEKLGNENHLPYLLPFLENNDEDISIRCNIEHIP